MPHVVLRRVVYVSCMPRRADPVCLPYEAGRRRLVHVAEGAQRRLRMAAVQLLVATAGRERRRHGAAGGAPAL